MSEVIEVKPRLCYAEFFAAQQKQQGSFAQLIERVIADLSAPGMGGVGTSKLYTLRAIARRPIGARLPESLRRPDFIQYCRERRLVVGPATINQEIAFISGVLKYASAAWEECEAVADAVAQLEAAKPFLVKHGLVGKSTPRKRVPTDEEVGQLLEYFRQPKRVKRMQIRMPDFIAFGLASTRRRGEICRFQWGDIDWNRKDADGNPTPMYMIRDLKHPTKKVGNHKWFPLFPELAEIIRMQPRLTDDPTERVFPFVPESVTASYIAAKKALGIVNLRLHDNRRSAITRWLKILKNPHKVKQISGHETTHILERVYDASDPAGLHAELALCQRAAA